MFLVTALSRPFLLWVSAELHAQSDMCLTEQRLRPGNQLPRRFVLEERVLRVEAGQSFLVTVRRSEGFRAGQLVPLDAVAHRRPISRKWQTLASL